MIHIIKYTFISCLLLIFTQIVHARSNEDADRIFNWAEAVFPELFSPANKDSQVFDVFYYRHYTDTDIYVAVTETDEVFLLGGPFSELTKAGVVTDFISGANTFADNNGQCITLPSVEGKMIRYTQTVTQPDNPATLLIDESIPETIDITTKYLISTDTKETIEETTSRVINGETAFPFVTTSTQESIYQVNGNNRALVSQIESIKTGIPDLLLDGEPIPETTETQTVKYTPARQTGPFKVLCQGDTWSIPSVKQIITLNENETTVDTDALDGKVAMINGSKSTKAGTFNSIQVELRSQNKSSPNALTSFLWIDVDTGLVIATKAISKNGTVVTREAIGF